MCYALVMEINEVVEMLEGLMREIESYPEVIGRDNIVNLLGLEADRIAKLGTPTPTPWQRIKIELTKKELNKLPARVSSRLHYECHNVYLARGFVIFTFR